MNTMHKRKSGRKDFWKNEISEEMSSPRKKKKRKEKTKEMLMADKPILGI